MGKCKIFPLDILMERTYIFKIFYSDFANFIEFSSVSKAKQLKIQ